MRFQVLNIKENHDVSKWKDIWNQWPCREVHAHPGYISLYLDDKSNGYCAILESDNGNVMYPFICRDISKESYGKIGVSPLCDIITPYGYGGYFVWNCTDKVKLSEAFRPYFDSWLIENNIVSEVIKFNLFDQHLLPYEGDIEERLKNIVVELSPGEDELWMNFEHKVRKNIKKAIRHEVSVMTDDSGKNIESFLNIYHGTLERRNAKEVYYFNDSFFNKLHKELAGQFIYFHAVHSGAIISTELVLLSSESVYSFLGGTSSDKLNLSPNDLLKFEVIKWAKNNGKKYFVVGGGLEPDDGIYRYKKSFAPDDTMPFYIGTRILRKDLYDKITENRKHTERINNHDWIPVKGFIPEYRT